MSKFLPDEFFFYLIPGLRKVRFSMVEADLSKPLLTPSSLKYLQTIHGNEFENSVQPKVVHWW